VKTTFLQDVEPHPRRAAVGTFDGVHLGHREVITGADTVLTFEPHPIAVVQPGAAPRLLTDPERKAQLVASLGVQELVVIPFDREFATRTALQFVDEVLVGALGATHVSVGENFRFGHKAQGDAALLCADERFQTRVVELLEVDGEIVSSSHIRGLVLGGAVEYADKLLGAPFTVTGDVAHGDKRGRTLGFPTANLVPDPAHAVPDHGIYACRAIVPGMGEWTAAVSIGVRPTFVTGRGLLVEAFLLDFDDDLYGRELRLDFVDRIRGERRFDSAEALVERMHQDVEEIRRLF
jgi:riboflavin kinase/FMN adenylyltransferase